MMFKFQVITLLCVINVLPVFSDEATQPNEDDHESYGVLITGGNDLVTRTVPATDTAELYLPSSDESCSLPKLPHSRADHTVDSTGLICGGLFTDDSCYQWNNGTWETLNLTLDVGRYHHVSWTPGSGIGTYLIGGSFFRVQSTTTLIKPDQTQEPGFTLKYRIELRGACAIPADDTVILTGGKVDCHNVNDTVSVYTVEGWQKDLPQLRIARTHHACSSYWADERRILIVMGGQKQHTYFSMDSIETYDPKVGSWAFSRAKLPSPLYALRAANIDGRVLIFGGRHGAGDRYIDDILEYSLEEQSIIPLGQMLQARAFHAVSVVKTKDYIQWCQQSSSAAKLSPAVLTITLGVFKVYL